MEITNEWLSLNGFTKSSYTNGDGTRASTHYWEKVLNKKFFLVMEEPSKDWYLQPNPEVEGNGSGSERLDIRTVEQLSAFISCFRNY